VSPVDNSNICDSFDISIKYYIFWPINIVKYTFNMYMNINSFALVSSGAENYSLALRRVLPGRDWQLGYLLQTTSSWVLNSAAQSWCTLRLEYLEVTTKPADRSPQRIEHSVNHRIKMRWKKPYCDCDNTGYPEPGQITVFWRDSRSDAMGYYRLSCW
jgi:hypothetical protein